MTNILDLTGKIDRSTIEILRAVDSACSELRLPFIVVGATARDLILHHGYGASISRATRDIDFGINVPNWPAFRALRMQLLNQGFTESNLPHRVVSASGLTVDLIPFGGVEEEGAIIKWPPKREEIMNILGFAEAHQDSMRVQLDGSSRLIIPVVSPCGLALLKIIAWTDRTPHMRTRDAQDLAYLLRNFEEIPTVTDHVYNDQGLLAKYDYDVSKATAYLLGQKTGHIASPGSREIVGQFMSSGELSPRSEILVFEMGGNAQLERNSALWNTFLEGFADSG